MSMPDAAFLGLSSIVTFTFCARGEWRLALAACTSLLNELINVLLRQDIQEAARRGGSTCSAFHQALSALQQGLLLWLPVVYANWGLTALDAWERALHHQLLNIDAEDEEAEEGDGSDEASQNWWVPLVVERIQTCRGQLINAMRSSLRFGVFYALVVLVASRFVSSSEDSWQPFCTTTGPVLGSLRYAWIEPPLPAIVGTIIDRLCSLLYLQPVLQFIGRHVPFWGSETLLSCARFSSWLAGAETFLLQLAVTIVYLAPLQLVWNLHRGESTPNACHRRHWLALLLLRHLAFIIYLPATWLWGAVCTWHVLWPQSALTPSWASTFAAAPSAATFSLFGESLFVYQRIALAALILCPWLEPCVLWLGATRHLSAISREAAVGAQPLLHEPTQSHAHAHSQPLLHRTDHHLRSGDAAWWHPAEPLADNLANLRRFAHSWLQANVLAPRAVVFHFRAMSHDERAGAVRTQLDVLLQRELLPTGFDRASALAIEAVAEKERNAAFVPAAAFDGARTGFVFKVGVQGLGYYGEDCAHVNRLRHGA